MRDAHVLVAQRVERRFAAITVFLGALVAVIIAIMTGAPALLTVVSFLVGSPILGRLIAQATQGRQRAYLSKAKPARSEILHESPRRTLVRFLPIYVIALLLTSTSLITLASPVAAAMIPALIGSIAVWTWLEERSIRNWERENGVRLLREARFPFSFDPTSDAFRPYFERRPS